MTAYTFRRQCIEIHQRIYPKEDIETIVLETQHETADVKEHCEDQSEVFEEHGDEEETIITEEGGDVQYGSSVNENQFSEVEQEYDDVYLEFEEEDEEIVEQKDTYEKPKIKKDETILNRKSYTVDKKLKIIEYAETHNNRVAARFFNMNESSIRCFRRQKDVLLKMNPEKKTNRRAFPHWPVLEKELKEFVVNYPIEHGVKAKLKDIKQESIAIAEKQGIDNFNGSNSWCFKFMQRHKLPSASPRPRKQLKFDADSDAFISSKGS